MKWVKKKGANRRFTFLGWDNYTDFEREWIDKVKDQIKKDLKVDLRKLKPFGPRSEDGAVVEGSHEIVNGRDPMLTDAIILKYIVARYFDMD